MTTPDPTVYDPRPVTGKRLGTILSLRLTPDLAEKVFDAAAADGVTVSEFIRRAVYATVIQPIGWTCEHLTVTGPRGIGPVTSGCRCRMKPIYTPEEVPSAA